MVLTVDGGDDLTSVAWESRSNAVAQGLTARGAGPGTRVGLLFDSRSWADYAVAFLGVQKAGGVPVLLSPGAARPELVRALGHSGAAGLLCPLHLDAAAGEAWVAGVNDVSDGQSGDPIPLADEPAAPVVYALAPLAPARAVVTDSAEPPVDGPLVHAWAPGTVAGQVALGLMRAGHEVGTVAPFDPSRFCRLLASRRARTCGLTPALAAAVVAAPETSGDHDLSSVTRVVLSGPPSPPLRAGLEALFPGAELHVLAGTAPDDRASAPVAVSQEAMLWHEQFAPGSFNLPCLVRRYEGPLDVAALEGALAELVRRHEPLRATFTLVAGEPRQVVGDGGSFTLPLLDLGGLGADERDAEAARLLADATSRPFELTAGPLFDPSLVRLGPGDHLLVVRLHHTVFDDWSVDILRRELSALYAAGLGGTPSPLAEPRIGFSEASRRQRAALAGDRGAAERSWWRRQLAGAPLAVQLPLGDGGGDAVRLDLPPALAAGVRELAPRLRATPFMTVLAAFSVLLGQATGQDDLLIATVVAHRNDSDLEPLIGCFTKKVALRLRLGGDPSFADLVARTRTSLLGSLSHQDVAFDAAVQEGLGDAAADHGVVPQVAVVFQGETPQRVRLAMPGLRVGPYEVRPESRRERHFSARADAQVWGDGMYLDTFLILSLLETVDGLALVARGVFSRPAVRRFLVDFGALLAGAVADPYRPVSALGARPPGEPGPDDIEWRGFRASRPHLEAALGRCPGVAGVGVAVRDGGDGDLRLVADVVLDGPPPTLAELRHALWAALPGALWPADAVVVDVLPRRPVVRAGVGTNGGLPSGADAVAGLLAAMWGEISGRAVSTRQSYRQDFSFLQVLAEAREAGLIFGDEQVARCRTLEMLAAACR